MSARHDLVTWAAALVVGAIVGVVSGAGSARLGAALTGSVIAATIVVIGRLVLEERADR